jgi:hypothetical protein
VIFGGSLLSHFFSWDVGFPTSFPNTHPGHPGLPPPRPWFLVFFSRFKTTFVTFLTFLASLGYLGLARASSLAGMRSSERARAPIIQYLFQIFQIF